MAYTKEELTIALAQADAAGDLEGVNALVGMLDALPQEGYNPAQFGSTAKMAEGVARMGKSIADVPQFVGELYDRPPSYVPESVAGAFANRGVLGTGLDVVGEGVLIGARVVSNFIPDSAEKVAVDYIAQVGKDLAQIPEVESVLSLMSGSWQDYQNWKSENPKSGELAESVLNVAEAFLPPLRRSPVPDKTGLRTAADVQFDRAKSLETGQRRDFINDIITPISTKANDEARAARMFQNEKGRNIYKSTDEEIEMINVLQMIPEIDKKKSMVPTKVIIDSEITKTHNSLQKLLSKSKVKLNKKELSSDLEDYISITISESPVLVGDAEKVAMKLFDKAKDLLNKTDGSPVQVMEVRHELDKWIKKSGKESFDGNENAYTVAQRTVRDFLNTAVKDAVPEAPVHDKLRRQHLLLRAKDRVIPKAAKEADTRLGRHVQNLLKATDSSLPKTPMARIATVASGATAVGGAAFTGALPALTGLAAAGGLGYALYRGSISPSLRKSLSATLRFTDNVLSNSGLNKEMRHALQTDRVLIVELMKLPTAPEGVDDDMETEE